MSVAVRVSTPAAARRGVLDVIRDYNALTKPRVVVLLEVTTLFAMIVAAHGMPSPVTVIVTLIGGWLAAGGAHAINCWFDRDIDYSMGRTRHRPVPSGRVEPAAALTFGIALGVASFVLLTAVVNLLAASLAIAGLLFYVLVYTMWLKRTSPSNIVIGGAAGAFPPLVGWAAVQGHLTLTAFFLFAIIFYWTPPHFWTLALLIRGDYARVGVPMMPVVTGPDYTRRQIALYSVIMVLVTLLPFLTRAFGPVYLGGALLLGGVFLALAVNTVRRADARSARRLFYYSMLYLALLFALMAVDSMIGTF